MGYRITLSASACRDLRGIVRGIVRYISFDSPDRALAFGQYLLGNTKRLADFPELGRIVPEFGDSLIREVIVRSYRLVYRVNHERKRIEVVRFWHAARGNPDLFEG
jgi:toxin ParE1/3/4